jgi:DnaJ-class molecular chaperone
MSHICANDKYRSQGGAINRQENIVIRFQFSFTDFSPVYRSAFAQMFPRSQPMRESNTSNTVQSIEKNIDMTFEEAQVSIL